jgi:5-methylcytosine-specific restriction protein A
MPTLPGHICNHAGCTAKTRNPYCSKHERAPLEKRQEFDRYRNANDPIRAMFKVVRWTEGTRLIVRRRDPLCTECGHRASTDVDHHPMSAREIVERFGVDEFYNPARCRGLCHSCHSKKTFKEKS